MLVACVAPSISAVIEKTFSSIVIVFGWKLILLDGSVVCTRSLLYSFLRVLSAVISNVVQSGGF